MSDVLIVGGGLAGLSCALHLHERGVPFQLFEAGDAVGGRVRTDEIDGFLLDRGFQVLLTAYPEARRILDYPDLQLQPFYPGALVRFNGRMHLVGDPLRKPWDLWATLRSPMGSLGDKLRVGRLRGRLRHTALDELFSGDDIPTSAWLAGEGFSHIMINRFFRPFLGGVFLDKELQTSSRMFRFVFSMFSSGAVAVPRDGMGAIPKQLCRSLPDERIHLNAPVAKVERNAIQLEDGRRWEGRCVVVATDMDAASRWLPERPSRAWSGVTCLYFDAATAPVEKPILVLNGEDQGRINNLHVVSRVNPACAPTGRELISVTVVGVHPDAVETECAVRRELVDWFGPSVESWRCLRSYALPHALPHQSPGVLNPAKRPVRNASGLYVCGDHVDQASIQGAMVSGRRAAEAVIADGET